MLPFQRISWKFAWVMECVSTLYNEFLNEFIIVNNFYKSQNNHVLWKKNILIITFLHKEMLFHNIENSFIHLIVNEIDI